MEARLLKFGLPAIAIAFILASPASGQTLQGTVLDADSSEPVVGAIVKALGATGEVANGTLSDARGQFVLTPTVGTEVAALTVERIGYETQLFERSSWGGTTGIELRVGSAVITLGGIVVTGESLCGSRFGDAGGVQTFWDEARKNLEITAQSRTSRAVRFQVENYQRDIQPNGSTVLRGSSERFWTRALNPYTTLTIDQMTESGWVEGNAYQGMELYAPDAALLMAEEFASQHCFRAELDGAEALLHFVPNDQRRSMPEIEGTMVLDAETSELTALRFRYVNLPDMPSTRSADGEVNFFNAPNGLRVVGEWAVRAPAITVIRSADASPGSDRYRVDYIHEEGGRILTVESADTTLALTSDALDLGNLPPADEAGQTTMIRPVGNSASELVLFNHDPVPFRVSEVRLLACSNTALDCARYPVDILVPPGESAVLLRVRKDNVTQAYRFEWDYAGSPVSE